MAPLFRCRAPAAVLVVAHALFTPHASVGAQASPGDAALPVYLTISGGVAAGSYQSGVNWGLLRVIRLSSDSGWRFNHGFQRPLVLGGMAGASAGSINALLTAMEYCAADDRPDPRQSLFWRLWIPTGFTSLLGADKVPAGRSSDGGVFDRRVMRDVYLQALIDFGARERFRSGCEVPLGLTVTRLIPAREHVLGGQTATPIRAPVTRHAATFALRADDPQLLRHQSVSFRDFAPDATSAHFGHRIWIASEDPRALSIEDVYPLLAASSAFPLAFSPVTLQYSREPDCRPRRCSEVRATFVDGGAFDNNPVDLVIGLRRYRAARPPAGVDSTRSLVVFIDPDERRGPPDPVPHEQLARSGLLGLMDLASGFLSAGRSYELASLRKLVDLNPDAYALDLNPIRTSDRRFAIVGSELGAFAAFLGKPYREFDFYVGVYDGLYAAARLFPAAGDSTARSTASQDGERLWNLLQDTAIVRFDADRALLVKLWEREFRKSDSYVATLASHEPRQRGPTDAERLRVYAALAEAAFGMDREERRDCQDLLLGGVYCRSGFARFVSAVKTPEMKAAVRGINMEAGCARPETVADHRDGCFGDPDFLLVRDRGERGIYDLLTRVQSRLHANEKALGTSGAPLLISTAGLLFNQASLATRRGLDLDPSTIPRGFKPMRCLRCWIPYRFTSTFGVSGTEIGYRPTLRLASGFGLVFPLTPILFHEARRDSAVVRASPESRPPAQVYFSTGGGILLQRGATAVSSVELSVRRYVPFREARLQTIIHDRSRRSYVGYDASTQVLAGRIEVGARWFPDNRGPAYSRSDSRHGGPTTLNGGYPFAAFLSVPDLPGLAYWLLPWR
jgi:predicted acylesterase/phospholipase RssA